MVRFHDWDTVASHWVKPPIAASMSVNSTGGSVAAWIVGLFDLNLVGEKVGSSLPGYDINNRDAYDMIKLSLAGELCNGSLYECYATEDGDVKFYHIGHEWGYLDVLYKIEGSVLRPKADLIVVSGFDPPPIRYAGDEFDLLRFGDSEPEYIAWGDIFGPDLCPYYNEGYIIYSNPHFDDSGYLVSQGVYNPKNFESLIGFVYKIHVPFYTPGYTTVNFCTTSPKIVELSGFGKLQRKRLIDVNTMPYRPSICYTGTPIAEDAGIELPESDDDRFIGVRAVYIYGYKIKSIRPCYYRQQNNRIAGEAIFIVDLDTMEGEPFQLTAGSDYIVVKKADRSAKIVFLCEVGDEYLDRFGGSVEEAGKGATSVVISPLSIRSPKNLGQYADPREVSRFINEGSKVHVEGVLADGITPADSTTIHHMRLFPIGDGRSAYAVEKILIVYDWNEPCIHVRDNRNIVDSEHLRDISVSFYPLISQDPPPPIATQNGPLDPSEAVPDVDPLTVEDLEGTEYNRVLSSLDGADIRVNLPFLFDSGECASVAGVIFGLRNSGDKMCTYVCSPNSEPKLGQYISDSATIVNSITYSYQDSNSYFITVETGPIWHGLSSWDTSIFRARTEQVQTHGRVVSVSDDNSLCQVLVDKFGLMSCINMTHEIINRGDRVAVTIYNNPVEV